jgi:glycosyltransferase involved in cell wall biosynthesis
MNELPMRISVIIPAYNASAYIEPTILSILGQTRPADEIVVVDDGSTDDTAKIAAGVSDKVVVVRQKNGGQGSARQRGAEATNAELLLFLDADDILYPAALEKLSASLLAMPQAALAYGLVEIWSPDDPGQARIDTHPDLSGTDLWKEFLSRNYIRTPGCSLLRRAALIDVGGWDPDINLKGNEDWELWVRLAEKYPFIPVPEPLLKYRIHHSGFSRSRGKMFKSMFFMFAKQRSRWKSNSNRRLTVDVTEWNNLKFVVREIWGEARSAIFKGRFLLAAGWLYKILTVGTRPALNHLLSLR